MAPVKSPHKLSDVEIQERLRSLPEWTLVAGKLTWNRRFANFAEAFSFMTQVALGAERLDHHPDWKNIYNQVWIELHTHDAGGITEKDFQLAQEISRIKEF